MGIVVTIVNQKGGVGKTTTAVNLAAYLVRMGKKALLIDIDPQANTSSGVGARVQKGEEHIYHTLLDSSKFTQVVKPTAVDGLHAIPAHPDLAGAAVELVPLPRREFRLREVVQQARDLYDIIIIDCPPSLGLLTINGLVAADRLIIPVQAEYYALEGLGQLVHTIHLVQHHLHPELSILGAVITMFDHRNRLSKEVMHELYSYFPHRIFRTIIPRTVRLAEAPSYSQPIMLYDPKGRGAKAYERLARELLAQLGYQ